MEPLILASTSPQRSELLLGLGIPFEVIPSALNESDIPEVDPKKRASKLALLKAEDVATHHPDRTVIGCDTLVVAEDGTLLEKPVDAADARRMLELLSGKTAIVHSALALVSPKGTFEDISSSEVLFKNLSSEEKEWWIHLGLWEGRSGGFQIDGPGQLIIQDLKGDWTSVVGLPVYLLGQLLKKAGMDPAL